MGNGISNENIKAIVKRTRMRTKEYESAIAKLTESKPTSPSVSERITIWIDVQGRPEKVNLRKRSSPAEQRRAIATHFGLSPAVQIEISDPQGNLIIDELEANAPDLPYLIECRMTLPPELDGAAAQVTGGAEFEALLEGIVTSMSIDVWEYETNQLLRLIEFMFLDLGVLDELKIEMADLHTWLVAVEHNYRTVPFHNFRHAFSVTHMMYYIIRECDLSSMFTTLQLGVLLVACICHDLDHPGLNNMYQNKAKTDISLLYENCSPLEHHHCAVAFQVFSVESLNIFRNISEQVQGAVTTMIIELILATDMALHNEILEEFLQNVKNGFSIDNAEHSLSLQKILIKCCDISNEVRPLEFSEPWVDRLLEEFFFQADVEKEEGLPVAGFMDRDKVHKSRDQLKFIRATLMPLFNGLSDVLPPLRNVMSNSLIESERYYERMTDKESKAENETKTTPSK
ncbi:high affinity cGMP-specific 3',5'-cyclic phosphodiesterase 9A-like [Styela clava]|uniref:high affinity cGMP-specific 3',5'-cyclic phosphodiesterase 9A-like n=1 Tax=Styela clava TaxID=7725 RepID=UPI0019398841|nr:high affinity cGMP-specific 3',5'-cyclic phosphodiesterase 9A-like [Styela clava]